MAGQHLCGPQLAISSLIIRSSRVEIAVAACRPCRSFDVAPATGPLQDARLPIVSTGRSSQRDTRPLINQATETWFDGVNV
jgi:hypothetical protein